MNLLYIVVAGVDSADLSVARVKGRTEEGGHDVPEDKIRARYDRGHPLIREAALSADRGMVFDNSPAHGVLLEAGHTPHFFKI